jgi:hypothetical protein
MQVTVTVTKTDWSNPVYSLEIDNEQYTFKSSASWVLTEAFCTSDSLGIFSAFSSEPSFRRDDTIVSVDFGDTWYVTQYPNPAQEIARRVCLVREAFEDARESYERTYTVTI